MTEEPRKPPAIDRRSLLVKGAVAGGALWIAPSVISVSPAAASSPFGYIAGSNAQDIAGPNLLTPTGSYTRTITLKSANVTKNDLWVAIIAYSGAPGASFSNTVGGVTMTTIAKQQGGAAIYSVGAAVAYKKLTAADIVGGSFTATFVSSNNSFTFGDLRGAAAAYGTAVMGGITVSQGLSSDTPDTSTVAFPAAAGAPLSGTNIVLSLGAARGYGGWTATDPNIAWNSAPGTVRNNFNGGTPSHGDNEGDRAVVISERANNAGASANGVIFGQTDQVIVSVNDFRNWVTYTAVLTPG